MLSMHQLQQEKAGHVVAGFVMARHGRDRRPAAGLMGVSCVLASDRETDLVSSAQAVERQMVVCRRNVQTPTFADAASGHTADPTFGVAYNRGGSPVAYSISTQNTEQHRCNAV